MKVETNKVRNPKTNKGQNQTKKEHQNWNPRFCLSGKYLRIKWSRCRKWDFGEEDSRWRGQPVKNTVEIILEKKIVGWRSSGEEIRNVANEVEFLYSFLKLTCLLKWGCEMSFCIHREWSFDFLTLRSKILYRFK